MSRYYTEEFVTYDDNEFDREAEQAAFDDDNGKPEYQQWFLEECFELYLLLKHWTERNGLSLCEHLTTEHLEEFLSNDFTFLNDPMDLDNSRFLKWRGCYEKWIDDICYYEIRWTLFNACPMDNFFWFMFRTSSGSVSEFA